MAAGVLLVASHTVPDESRFTVQCHSVVPRPFVVLAFGDYDTTIYVYEPAHLVELGQVVAEAHDLLTGALAGQDPLPVEQTALLA